ncbi:MAG: 4Fe-4S single cluster domain-containing protein [Desulfomonilaceae bacterium]
MAILNLHNWAPISKANGPGDRFVLWFQGCSLKCPGCFNVETHSTAPHILMPHEEIAAMILGMADRVEGMTISGGEPMEQPLGSLLLLEAIHKTASLSVVLYSGYTYEEIRILPHGLEILDHVDILIAGRFNRHLATPKGIVGSSNQEIRFLSSRYTPLDITDWSEAELIIDKEGQITVSGVQAPLLTV